MNQLAYDRRHTGDRVVYQTQVRLLTFGPTRDFWVKAENISESGMFVTSQYLFPMGTELLVDVPTPMTDENPEQSPVSVAMRGRVVWQEVDTGLFKGGMGIAFLDLTEHDLAALREVVQQSRPMDRVRRIQVFFDGADQPTKAYAQPTPDGLLVSQTPPYLKRLRQEGQPDARALEHTLTRWPPRLSDASPKRPSDDDGIPFEVELSDILAAMPEPQGEVKRPHKPPPHEEHSAPPAEEAPEPEQDPGDQLKQQEPERFSFLPPDDMERSVWDMEPLADDEPRPRLDPGRGMRLGLWLAALLMTGLAAASVVHTDLWQRMGVDLDWLQLPGTQRQAAAPKVKAPRPRPRPQVAAKPAAKPAPVPAKKAPIVVPAPPALVAPSPAPVKVAAPAPAPGGTRLQTTDGGQTVLVVPLKGSIKGARTYRLSRPAALAINLPLAQPTSGYSDLRPGHDAMRLIWVRARLGGLHLRVFFNGTMPAHKVQIRPGELRVELLPAP